MNQDWLITFRSITYAQRAQFVLRSAMMDSRLQRTPKELSGKGCGYALRLREPDGIAAAQLLRQKGVPFNKLFFRTGDGKMEEQSL